MKATKKAAEKRQRPLKLLPSSGPLQFVGKDILGPLSMTLNGKKLIRRAKYCIHNRKLSRKNKPKVENSVV